MKFKWSDIALLIVLLISSAVYITYLLSPEEIQDIELVSTDYKSGLVNVKEKYSDLFVVTEDGGRTFIADDSKVRLGDKVKVESSKYKITYKKGNRDKETTITSSNKEFMNTVKSGDDLNELLNSDELYKAKVIKEEVKNENR